MMHRHSLSMSQQPALHHKVAGNAVRVAGNAVHVLTLELHAG